MSFVESELEMAELLADLSKYVKDLGAKNELDARCSKQKCAEQARGSGTEPMREVLIN